MPSEHDLALAKMQETFAVVDELRSGWLTRTAPPAGTALALDDETWPSLCLSDLARMSLYSAWDHFDVVKLTFEAQRLFPTGVNGVLRGALVAASQAVWLLGSDEAGVRRERGLMVAEEWYARRIQWQKGMTDMLPTEDQVTSLKQIDLMQSHLDRVRALRTTAEQLQPTAFIQWAARHRFGAGSTQAQMAVQYWRQLGGDAHAIGWQFLLQDVEWQEKADQGLHHAVVTGSISSVAEPYLCAWYLFRQGLERMDALHDAAA